MTHIVVLVLQVLVALGLLNVWLVRARQTTPYRGGKAGSIGEEFAEYGLPPWAMYAVGGLKIAAAVCLLIGIWLPQLVFPAAAVVAVLMVGAIGMHLKVKDSVMKSVPAFAILVMCLGICVGVTR